jgi:hypothetical protein
VGVEIGGGQQAQFGEHGGLHLLRLVDDEHRPGQRAVDVRLPALAQDLGAAPAVVRAQFDAEEFAHLAIEVGDVGLRPADHADRDVALCRQRWSARMRKTGGFAAAGRAGDEGEAAFGGQLLDAPAERFQARGDVQRLGRHVGGERVPFEAVEREHLVVHASSPSSLGR